ncbi:MAG: type IV secretory system conjugative DNA transfer family protein, partial [Saccharofermentanales bacterium]
MQPQITTLILAATVIFSVLGIVSVLSHKYSLDSIKSRTVGDGQFGTARFASNSEIRKTYKLLDFDVKSWRHGKNLPDSAGIVVGCRTALSKTSALVDSGDVHAIMIGAAGVGKTAFFLYSNLEYACASGTSFITSDTKGDLYRNYGAVAKEYYGYDVAVIDLRNPTRSDEHNILNLVNKYMDEYRLNPENISAKA